MNSTAIQRTIAGLATTAATLALAVTPAIAAPSAVPDLPVSATPCKLDTSPQFPSCGGQPASAQFVPPGLKLKVKECKLDTSPSFPSCGARIR